MRVRLSEVMGSSLRVRGYHTWKIAPERHASPQFHPAPECEFGLNNADRLGDLRRLVTPFFTFFFFLNGVLTRDRGLFSAIFAPSTTIISVLSQKIGNWSSFCLSSGSNRTSRESDVDRPSQGRKEKNSGPAGDRYYISIEKTN